MAQIEYKMAAMWAGDEFICIFCILTLMSILNNTSVYLGRVSMLKKIHTHVCTHTQTHIYTYMYAHSFSQGLMTLTHMCASFSTAVFTTRHLPTNRGEVKAHRMG